MDRTTTNTGSSPVPLPPPDASSRLASACTDAMAKIRELEIAFNKARGAHLACLDETERTREVLGRFAPKDTVYVADCALSAFAETVLDCMWSRRQHEREEACRREDEYRKGRDMARKELSESNAALNEVSKENDRLREELREARAHLEQWAVMGVPTEPLAKLQDLHCPCGGTITFRESRLVGVCQRCGHTCRVLEQPRPADPVTMPPAETRDESLAEALRGVQEDRSALTVALVAANRNTAKWRNRALEWREAALHERARLLNLRGELIPAPEPLPEGWEDN